jgi:hypothetical protein
MKNQRSQNLAEFSTGDFREWHSRQLAHWKLKAFQEFWPQQMQWLKPVG